MISEDKLNSKTLQNIACTSRRAEGMLRHRPIPEMGARAWQPTGVWR